MTSFSLKPIGVFHSLQTERYAVPRQGGELSPNQGKIILFPQHNYEQALEDLDGFDRLWIIFWFDRNQGWKPKVMPPRGGIKKGVFATRSPHRPNPLGLSCVELKKIEGLELHIANHDLLNGTPILDLKPYLSYADSYPNVRQGWLENLSDQSLFSIEWSLYAEEQRCYLEHAGKVYLKEIIATRLTSNPFPYPNHRIKKIGNQLYELACKTWRISYEIDERNHCIVVQKIESGYDLETLEGKKSSKWNDVSIHLDFIRRFNSKILS